MTELVVADINGNEEDSRQIETLLIDLDDTLYQVHEAPELVRDKIQGILDPQTIYQSYQSDLRSLQHMLKPRACVAAYMKEKLKIPEEDIQKVCLEYYTNYGTTMAGLVVSKLFGICKSSAHLWHAWLWKHQ